MRARRIAGEPSPRASRCISRSRWSQPSWWPRWPSWRTRPVRGSGPNRSGANDTNRTSGAEGESNPPGPHHVEVRYATPPDGGPREVFEHGFQLVDLRAFAVLRREDVCRVAAHPHAGEPALQLLLLLARERTPVRDREQPGDATLVVTVQL